MPALIAANASSSGTGVGFQVIIISPCYGQMSGYRCGDSPLIVHGWTYCDFADNNIGGCAAKFRRVCHDVVVS